MKHPGLETEVKLRVLDIAATLDAIKSAGFTVTRKRQFESNVMFDSADHSLRQRGLALRVRDEAGKISLTQKGPVLAGTHKSREENEVTVSALEPLVLILDRLGYFPVFRYEKYRTEFRLEKEAGLVLLDETPVGNFLELEGTGDWIDLTAKRLGFNETHYILESYGALYRLWCLENGIPGGDMIFSA